MSVQGAPLFAPCPHPAPQVTRKGYFRSRAHLTQDKKEVTVEEAKDVEVKDIKLKVPASWKTEKPSNNLRLAQFKLPAADGEDPVAELVVSSFGGDGGGVDQNLKRWNDQFVPEGRKIKLTTGESTQGKYHLSDVSGTYLQTSGGPFAGGKKTPKPGYRSLSVAIMVPDSGMYFLRLTGPEKTVTNAVDAFRKSFGADASKETEYSLK